MAAPKGPAKEAFMSTETAPVASPASGMRLKDKVAIITGSAQGIGLATAELFVREGARVAIVDVDAAKAQASAQSLDGGRGASFGQACDVTKPADCEAVVKAVQEKWGKIDILVNNA